MRKRTNLLAVALLSLLVAAGVGCNGTDEPTDNTGEDDNKPPVAEFSVSPATQVEVNTEISLSAADSTDPDGDSLEFTWGITGPNMEFTQQGSGESYTFTPPNPGRYTVDLSVTDGTATGRASKSIVALPEQMQNQPPTANITGPQEVAVGNSVDLIGSGSSDPDGDPLSYSWSFAGGSCDAGSLGSDKSSATVTFTGDQMGSCDVELEVSDGRGGSDSATLSVSVVQGQPDNQPPSVIIEGTAGWTGQTIQLRAQASDDNDSVSELSFDWTVDSAPSGASASIQNADSQEATYTPDVAGDHVVKLTVTDTDDASTEKSKTFTVEERPDPVKPNAGDIWINEVMVNPSHVNDSNGEWIELATNATSTIFDLSGCTLKDDTGQGFTIPESAPNFSGNKRYYTLAKADGGSTAVNFTPDVTWETVPGFNNGEDTVDLNCNNQDLDSVNYDSSYPVEEGKTLQLDASVVSGAGSPASANNDPGNWCAVGQQNSGLYGTPGAVNLTCN